MTKAERYVRRYLAAELAEVLALPIARVQNGLTIYEKTLIYHYTKDGYEKINEWLRSPKKLRMPQCEICMLLKSAVRKLPAARAVVFRTVDLSQSIIDKYSASLNSGSPIVDVAFISTSQSPMIARSRPRYNVKFTLTCFSGRSVEEVSYMGIHSSLNEREVLLLPGSKFRVDSVTKKDSIVLIKLTEL